MSKRYIDADALLTKLPDDLPYKASVKRVLMQAPNADVVEPVRCKDCKFWGIPNINDTDKSHYCCRDNMWCMPLRFADDYCSYGKRRDDGK